MALWYALVCLTDQFMPNGKLDYQAGVWVDKSTATKAEVDLITTVKS